MPKKYSRETGFSIVMHKINFFQPDLLFGIYLFGLLSLFFKFHNILDTLSSNKRSVFLLQHTH